MSQVMAGVRILEVAEQTFVPAAAAILAEWGAEVVKVEHVERGDSMRGLASSGFAAMLDVPVHVLLEHSNRGKKSIGLDLGTEEGVNILYRLAETSDVFVTNKLARVRTRLRIDVEDMRAHNPNIIYVRGTGQGDLGPDADKGSYDALGYWNRSGAAMGATDIADEHVVPQPAPAFGDSIGAMTIAGGNGVRLAHTRRSAGVSHRFHRSVDGRAGHGRSRGRPTGPGERLSPALRHA
jgi:crotonobetainyl-CoA:carnitine CoA-transferase CaiB-like acyl-CoA transferase